MYALVADLFVTLLFLAVGALLFWYRSADRMGLFVSLVLITVGSFGIDEVHIQAFQNPPLAVEIFGTVLVFLQWACSSTPFLMGALCRAGPGCWPFSF